MVAWRVALGQPVKSNVMLGVLKAPFTRLPLSWRHSHSTPQDSAYPAFMSSLLHRTQCCFGADQPNQVNRPLLERLQQEAGQVAAKNCRAKKITSYHFSVGFTDLGAAQTSCKHKQDKFN